MIIKKRNTPGREPFIGHTEFYTKRLFDAVAFSTPVLTQLRSRLRAVKHTEELWDRVGLSGFARRISTSSPGSSCFPIWRWAANQGDFERLLVAILFVKTHCILDFFSSCLPSQGHTSFSERTIDTFPKILCLGLSSSLRCVDQRKFGIHFALL